MADFKVERRCRAAGLWGFLGWARPAGEAAEGSGAKGWQNHDRYGRVGAVRGTWRGFIGRGRRLPTYDPVSLLILLVCGSSPLVGFVGWIYNNPDIVIFVKV